ncbi:putative beta-hexosaminidase [Mizuhopecten yessoensis]|uniref:putative beta-hexosaminidase n=1 Tax=Mizuhopecten yessoensis TaxID=6573 RepID=UPI000B45A005|nr:putative beta-hexosaminidase [Mizuhopecten yessoensis]
MELQSSGPLLLLILVMLVCFTSANVADIARNLTAHYELINHNPGGTYYASIILSNRGNTIITSDGEWSLYFCHENLIEFERFNTSTGQYINPTSRGGFLLSHIGGCMYKFTPDPLRFKNIMPNTMRRITFLAAASISGIFDVYPNFYIANSMQSSALIQNTKIYRYFVSPFTNIFQYTRDPPRDPILPVSPTRSYMVLANQTVHELEAGDILPTPLLKTAHHGKVLIDKSWRFYSPVVGPEVDSLMPYFTAKLDIPRTKDIRTENVILFEFNSAPSFVENSDEWYNLTTSVTNKYVKIVGKTTHGWLNGFQTLLNILEEKVQQDGTQYFEAPYLHIVDAPRFKHRSLLLDVASQFVPLPNIMKLLHMMALVKLNKLQLLLANDYGIRLEIDTLPGFHKVGSKRCHDESEQSCLFSQLGSDPSGTGTGSGYYTAKEYQQLLSLAKQLHIEIIPMWSFDSNMRASEIAIRAYSKASRNQTMNWSLPELDKTSLLKPNLFRIGKIDICADETVAFIRTIISTIKSYHSAAKYPLKTFGIGGEDTDPEAWYNKCLLRNKLNNENNPYVFSKLQFNIKLSNIFIEHNITLNAYDNQFSAFPTRCKNALDCTDWFTPYNLTKWIKNDNFKLSITHRDPRVMFMTRQRMMRPNDTTGVHDRETKMRMFQRNGYPSIISLQDVLDFSIKEEPGPYVQGEMPFGRSPIPLQHVFSMWPESSCCSRYECFPHTNPNRLYSNVNGFLPPLCFEDRNAPGPIGKFFLFFDNSTIPGKQLQEKDITRVWPIIMLLELSMKPHNTFTHPEYLIVLILYLIS